MADTFDFNNPLGLDEELEKENSLLGSPDIEKPQEEQNFDSVFEKNKNKKFVDRIINPENYPAPTLTDSQGRKQTHLMSADLDQNNDWVVYPKIILENNKYKRVNMEEAISSGNSINFGKNQDLAQGFSQNYKTKKFKEFYNEFIIKFFKLFCFVVLRKSLCKILIFSEVYGVSRRNRFFHIDSFIFVIF